MYSTLLSPSFKVTPIHLNHRIRVIRMKDCNWTKPLRHLEYNKAPYKISAKLSDHIRSGVVAFDHLDVDLEELSATG